MKERFNIDNFIFLGKIEDAKTNDDIKMDSAIHVFDTNENYYVSNEEIGESYKIRDGLFLIKEITNIDESIIDSIILDESGEIEKVFPDKLTVSINEYIKLKKEVFQLRKINGELDERVLIVEEMLGLTVPEDSGTTNPFKLGYVKN